MPVSGQRFWAALTPGVRVVLGLLFAVWLASALGKGLHVFDLDRRLALSGPNFWHGRVWRLVTYELLPQGILDLIINGVALAVLGGWLERHWTRGELWCYCLVAAAGAGLAKVTLQYSSPLSLTGAAPMMFGLLMAWGFLGGRETIPLFLWGETTVWKLVLAAAGVSILIQFFTAGLVPALILLAGGLTGYLYLWLKHQWLMNRTGSVVHYERISRLEL